MDIILNKVSKSYGEKKVINSFSADFPEGKVSAVTAPSGRGKSTLMRLILGLEKTSSGTVSGINVNKAALFQENRLFGNLSAEQNVRAAAGKRVTASQIEEIFSELGIGGEENTPAKELSGGMARRVSLARALLSDSKLLVMDEPFKGLDEANKMKVSNTVKRYAKGKTVIIFTHSEEEAKLMDAELVFLL